MPINGQYFSYDIVVNLIIPDHMRQDTVITTTITKIDDDDDTCIVYLACVYA